MKRFHNSLCFAQYAEVLKKLGSELETNALFGPEGTKAFLAAEKAIKTAGEAGKNQTSVFAQEQTKAGLEALRKSQADAGIRPR